MILNSFQILKLLSIRTILFILFFFNIIISAQQIYLAETHTEDGEPIGAKNIWDIKPWGSYISIILDYEDRSPEGSLIYMFIDKLVDGIFEPYDSKAINLESNKSWLVYNYKFAEPGEYEVYFVNITQIKIASERVTIKFEDEYSAPPETVSSSYYENCEIIFCKTILIGNRPLGIKRSLSLSNHSGTIYVFLNNYAPLNTDIFLVDIWRKKNRTYDYDEYVESKKYKLNQDWPEAYFQYQFIEAGEYKFTIYNKDEILIKSGYFTVYP
ncbi:hypothetical protein ACFLS9_01170 [Bacteroidota bacterium]